MQLHPRTFSIEPQLPWICCRSPLSRFSVDMTTKHFAVPFTILVQQHLDHSVVIKYHRLHYFSAFFPIASSRKALASFFRGLSFLNGYIIRHIRGHVLFTG